MFYSFDSEEKSVFVFVCILVSFDYFYGESNIIVWSSKDSGSIFLLDYSIISDEELSYFYSFSAINSWDWTKGIYCGFPSSILTLLEKWVSY